jgi:hypothetical protein
VDDVHGTDRYGRWVCVVYVRHNATHLLNVNEALLERGVAVLDDFPNQFNPGDWTLYVYSPEKAPSPTPPPTETPGTGVPTPSGGLDPALLVGIGIGASAVIAALIVLSVWKRRRARRP